MVFENEQTGRRHVQPALSRGAKPAGYWFKQRGYTDPSFDRRSATTTGQMLNQAVDTKSTSIDATANTPIISNRRHPDISHRISEHDNRNVIQNYGEYFGRGFGRRLMQPSTNFNHSWVYTAEPRHMHPDRSMTQKDYQGWPALESLHSASVLNRSRTNGDWMKSSYDNYGRESSSGFLPKRLLYHEDNKRIPIHPWHY